MTRAELICITAFLASIVTANVLVTHFGPIVLPFTAFFLIPVDLVTRDILHESWKGRGLWVKIAILVAAGSVLTILLNLEARWIALASFVGFSSATFTNAVVYDLLFARPRQVKMNCSNFLAATVDSAIFQRIAFGQIHKLIFLSQTGTKFAGGIFWIIVYVRILHGIKARKAPVPDH